MDCKCVMVALLVALGVASALPTLPFPIPEFSWPSLSSLRIWPDISPFSGTGNKPRPGAGNEPGGMEAYLRLFHAFRVKLCQYFPTLCPRQTPPSQKPSVRNK